MRGGGQILVITPLLPTRKPCLCKGFCLNAAADPCQIFTATRCMVFYGHSCPCLSLSISVSLCLSLSLSVSLCLSLSLSVSLLYVDQKHESVRKKPNLHSSYYLSLYLFSLILNFYFPLFQSVPLSVWSRLLLTN